MIESRITTTLVMCNLLVTALIIALSLIVSGNVELNPGPMKKCPKHEKMMPTRFIVDVVICYAMSPQGFCTLVHPLVECLLHL